MSGGWRNYAISLPLPDAPIMTMCELKKGRKAMDRRYPKQNLVVFESMQLFSQLWFPNETMNMKSSDFESKYTST